MGAYDCDCMENILSERKNRLDNGNCSEKPNNSGLQKCPFCGGEATVASVSEWSDCAGWWYVVCTNAECFVKPQTLHCYKEKADAMEAWNRRAKNDTV